MANMNKNNTHRGVLEANPSQWDEISGTGTTEQQQSIQEEIDGLTQSISDGRVRFVDFGRGYENMTVRDREELQEKLNSISTYDKDKQQLVDDLSIVESDLTGGQRTLPAREQDYLRAMGGGDLDKGAAMRTIELRHRVDVADTEMDRFRTDRIARGALASIRNAFGDLMMSKKDKDRRDTINHVAFDAEDELRRLYSGDRSEGSRLAVASYRYAKLAGYNEKDHSDVWQSVLTEWRNEKEEWGAES